MKLTKFLPLALVLTVAGMAWGFGASASSKNTEYSAATVETDNCCLTGDCCCPGQGDCCGVAAATATTTTGEEKSCSSAKTEKKGCCTK